MFPQFCSEDLGGSTAYKITLTFFSILNCIKAKNHKRCSSPSHTIKT
jgi:hypothetical protein